MKARERGFTLIELLLVVLIIGVLSGLTFKLFGWATKKALQAKTVGKLEQLAMALEEFRAEYGMYPPTSGTEYNIGPVGTTHDFLKVYLGNPDSWGSNSVSIYQYGLLSYLWPRSDASGQPIYTESEHDWRPDTERDVAAKQKWAKYLEGLKSNDNQEDYYNVGGSQSICATNTRTCIKDAWGQKVQYSSSPPYQTYELWSVGADGAGGTSDDVHRNKMDN